MKKFFNVLLLVTSFSAVLCFSSCSNGSSDSSDGGNGTGLNYFAGTRWYAESGFLTINLVFSTNTVAATYYGFLNKQYSYTVDATGLIATIDNEENHGTAITLDSPDDTTFIDDEMTFNKK